MLLRLHYLIVLDETWVKRSSARQGRKRSIFQRLSVSDFSWFFFRREMPFPSRKIPVLVDPKQKQISVVLKSKKKKKVFCSFSCLLPFHFEFSTFPFTIFLLFCPFPFFRCLSFPRTVSKIFPVKRVRGAPYPPSACYVTGKLSGKHLSIEQHSSVFRGNGSSHPPCNVDSWKCVQCVQTVSQHWTTGAGEGKNVTKHAKGIIII